MSTPPPAPTDIPAAVQIRLRAARAQVEEARRTELAQTDPASMMLMIDRLVGSVVGLADLVEALYAERSTTRDPS